MQAAKKVLKKPIFKLLNKPELLTDDWGRFEYCFVKNSNFMWSFYSDYGILL